MSHWLRLNQKLRNILIPVLTIMFFFGSFSYGAWFAYQYEVEMVRQEAVDDLTTVTNEIERLINQQIDRALGIAIYRKEQPGISIDALNHYSQQLFTQQGSVLRSIALTDDTTVVFVYPLEGNEIVQGIDLATIDGQSEAVIRAKREQRPVITPPVPLLQGGTGIICRIPLTELKDGITENFVGLLNVVIDYDRLLGQSGLLEATKQYDIKLHAQGSPDNVFFYTAQRPLSTPVTMNIKIRNEEWILRATPVEGWRTRTHFHKVIFGAGFLTAMMGFFYVRHLLVSKQRLNEKVKNRTKELRETNAHLEQTLSTIQQKQAELEVLNNKLETSLDELHETQQQLIQSEKLAALGELVAGVAHEINTPIGVGITLTTFLDEQHTALQQSFEQGSMRKSELEQYFTESKEALDSMSKSLSRAAEIINSFKNVAVGQTHLERRAFNLRDFVHDIVLSMHPKFKGTGHTIHVNCPTDLMVYTYPGAISHVLTNLIDNSLTHGLTDKPDGRIDIDISRQNDGNLRIHFSDNGSGIPEDLQNKVFNPFFTTTRGRGGSGLGLHIVHNSVVQSLEGHIELHSEPGHGVSFTIVFPASKESIQ